MKSRSCRHQIRQNVDKQEPQQEGAKFAHGVLGFGELLRDNFGHADVHKRACGHSVCDALDHAYLDHGDSLRVGERNLSCRERLEMDE